MFYYERCFFGYVARPGGEICWFANPPHAHELGHRELSLLSATEWKRQLINFYRLDSSPAREIIESSYEPIIASNQYLMPAIEAWRNDSMLIIGDAAHAPASATGQGASLAIEDAAVLARCLRDAPDVSHAFASYEGLRRPRTERVVALGREANRAKPSGGSGRALPDDVLAKVIQRNATKEFWQSQSWLFDYHIDWDERMRPADRGAA
jgi:2-polyprenyl-6-methoxyphenol hydroxylase-like FAD-dependent oxidoreductase